MPNLPVRDRSDAKLAGVCSALARTWAIDPLVVRVAFVVVGLLTNGFVLAVYATLWAILPERGGVAPLHRLFPATRSWSWGALATAVLIATALAAAATGTGPGAFVILALAWLILRFGFAGRQPGPTGSRPPAPPRAPQTPFERSAQAWQQRVDNIEAGRPADWVPELEPPDRPDLYGASSPWDAPTRSATRPLRRRRGLRTWLGILVALGVTWAGLAAASALDVVVDPLAWASATLLVLGVALLLTARPSRAVFGRPVLLLPLTVLVGLATLPLIVPTPLTGRSVGAIGAAATFDEVTRLPVGDHTVDLSSRTITDETLQYRLPLGDVTLVVPATGNVVVRATAVAGDVVMPDGTEEGINLHREWGRVTEPGAPTLTIDVWAGVGEVEVRS